MPELAEIKKDIERQIKELRKDMDAEFRLVHVEMKRLDEKIDTRLKALDDKFESRFREMGVHLRAIRDLLEPLRSIPERVARLEGAQEAATGS